MVEIDLNVDIAPYTSWKAGGQVKYLVKPSNLDSFKTWLKNNHDLPLMILGLGSNVLFPDGLLGMAVILTRSFLNDIQLLCKNSWYIQSGVSCAKIARMACSEGYRDASFFCGIPGTLGGALRMNAGAYGMDTWSFVDYVDVLNRQGEIIRLTKADISYSYRHVNLPNDLFFIGAKLSFFDHYETSQVDTIASLLKKRIQTQPIGLPSCGSVFKNPYPHHAGFLIESCGLKGFKIGGASVSTKHANFIINSDGATSLDIKNLISHVQEIVSQEHGILLEKEVIFI